jgi:hypothetical protein
MRTIDITYGETAQTKTATGLGQTFSKTSGVSEKGKLREMKTPIGEEQGTQSNTSKTNSRP